MKITYPECQIEISTDEVIDLLDYFEDREPKIECRHEFGPLNYKKPELHKPIISEEDKKEIDELMQKHFQESNLQLLRQTDPTRRGEGIEPLITKSPVPEFEPGGFAPDNEQPEPKPYPTEEEPAPGRVEIPKERKNESTKKKKASGKPKKVQVLFENGWKTFDSMSEAAKAIDARLNHLSHALLNGKTCNGHQVRYATDNN